MNLAPSQEAADVEKSAWVRAMLKVGGVPWPWGFDCWPTVRFSLEMLRDASTKPGAQLGAQKAQASLPSKKETFYSNERPQQRESAKAALPKKQK